MNEIKKWADKWSIPQGIVDDLEAHLYRAATPDAKAAPPRIPAKSESDISDLVRVAASKKGGRLFRNNVGAGVLAGNNRFIRWGLCNESKRMNESMKSSDLIGWTRVEIGSEHIGSTIAVFTAIECKAPLWRYREGDPQTEAQKRFIDLVNTAGGFGSFNSSGEF